MEQLANYSQDYRADLGGYFYVWNYTYNTLTHETDDRDNSHASMIDSLPAPIRRAARELTIWGKTDWFNTDKRFVIVNDEYLDSIQLAKIKRECGM